MCIRDRLEAGRGGRRLTRQISCECVHCVGFRWPKTTMLGKFWHLGYFCTDPLLPTRVKFGALKHTQGLPLQAKFYLNVSIVSASGFQKPQFWANFDILGAPVPTPLYRWGPNFMCYSRPAVHVYLRNFVLIGLFVLRRRKPRFLPFFWIRHLVVSPVGSSLRILNTGAQLHRESKKGATLAMAITLSILDRSAKILPLLQTAVNLQHNSYWVTHHT